MRERSYGALRKKVDKTPRSSLWWVFGSGVEVSAAGNDTSVKELIVRSIDLASQSKCSSLGLTPSVLCQGTAINR